MEWGGKSENSTLISLFSLLFVFVYSCTSFFLFLATSQRIVCSTSPSPCATPLWAVTCWQQPVCSRNPLQHQRIVDFKWSGKRGWQRKAGRVRKKGEEEEPGAQKWITRSTQFLGAMVRGQSRVTDVGGICRRLKENTEKAEKVLPKTSENTKKQNT